MLSKGEGAKFTSALPRRRARAEPSSMENNGMFDDVIYTDQRQRGEERSQIQSRAFGFGADMKAESP
jgi:hypothetical protein